VSSADVRVKLGSHLALNDNRLRTMLKHSNYVNTVAPMSPSKGGPYHIQGDSEGKVNILEDASNGHCEGKNIHMNTSILLSGYRDTAV
jgi:hypothetical protein